MDGPAAHELQDCVAGLLQLQAALDDVAVVAGEGDRVGVAEEVGGVQQVDVQGVAGDPFPAVQQPAQVSQRRVEHGAAGLLDGVTCAGLVGDRADPADAGGDIRRFGVGAAAQERFEEPRRLVDVQLGPLHLAVADRDPQRALAFDPGQPGDGELPSAVAHRGRPSAKAGAAALNVANTRPMAPSSMPQIRSCLASAGTLGAAIGPNIRNTPARARGTARRTRRA